MPFNLSFTNSSGAQGVYWALLSAQISSFPLATAQSTVVYGMFLTSDAYHAGLDPMATVSFVLPAALVAGIRTGMISTLETFLSTMTVPDANGDGRSTPGFFNTSGGATIVS